MSNTRGEQETTMANSRLLFPSATYSEVTLGPSLHLLTANSQLLPIPPTTNYIDNEPEKFRELQPNDNPLPLKRRWEKNEKCLAVLKIKK